MIGLVDHENATKTTETDECCVSTFLLVCLVCRTLAGRFPLTCTSDADASHHCLHTGRGLRAVQLQQHPRRPHGKPQRRLAAPRLLTHLQVLQQGPKQAVVWGFGTPGANVTVSMTPQVGPVGFTVIDATGVWSAGIGPVAASEQAYVIAAVSGGETIMLQDVLFGDVWVSWMSSNQDR